MMTWVIYVQFDYNTILSISKQTSQTEKKKIIDLVSELNRVNGVGWENQL